ncbi:patatin-like phospholipase family protein [Neorhizobium sp. T786]|uniref:patatin-like phospholipase family protein n=1 Tax=Pseudorhizobium xiangyangii TaxID=2883104 RepID=UPI001CFF7968|nr:patatin-like phospholipase family protein [Neorhizobium xiangyangii]MCB5203729.1 patatin-like phospholipase family protein [Neorhizobium xiangyangii]
MSSDQIWLCLSGGNALGAYQAGAYEALSESGVQFTRIAGASIGAVNGALILGNRPEERVARLQEFWRVAADSSTAAVNLGGFAHMERMRSSIMSLLVGKPGLFRPSFPGPWSALPFVASDDSLFRTERQRETLKRLIDFELLNQSGVPFQVTAVDIETGSDVAFANSDVQLSIDHIMASTAFPIAFPLVKMNGRTYGDPGLSANLPLRALFSRSPQQEVVCICLDLFQGPGVVPRSLEEAVGRTSDLLFASQTRHAISEVRNGLQDANGPSVTLIHAAYGGDEEIGLKAVDYSRSSLAQRWKSGHRDGIKIAEFLQNPPTRRRGRFDLWRKSVTGVLEYDG